MKNRIKNRHVGFTLVECLVVIVIVSVLITLLLPAISQARTVASVSVCASQIRQLSVGMSSYVIDNKDYIPPCYPSGNPYQTSFVYINAVDNGSFVGLRPDGLGVLWAYGAIASPKLFFCPLPDQILYGAANRTYYKQNFKASFDAQTRFNIDYAVSYYNDVTSTTSLVPLTQTKLVDTYKRPIWIADAWTEPSGWELYRTYPHNQGDTVNLGKYDGSVKTATDLKAKFPVSTWSWMLPSNSRSSFAFWTYYGNYY